MARRNAQAMAHLAEWMDRLDRVASPQFKAANTREMSAKTLELIQEGFRTESTPYGMKWRAKKFPNGEAILIEKDKMRNQFKVTVKPGAFTVHNAAKYYRTHQHGAPSRNIPRRQMVPDPNKLPAKWIREYQRIVTGRFFRIIAQGKRT